VTAPAWSDTLYDSIALAEAVACGDREGMQAVLKAAGRPWKLVEALARLLDALTADTGEVLDWDDTVPGELARDPSRAALSARLAARQPAAWCEVLASLVNAVAARHDVDVRGWAASRA
jgi:hypothetical protein